ncbi:hypothetical protein C8Q80DRAFT_343797 [Daedaleopsis nitida]|nr:hypothetical protein C8Q80DRAFT_343797 [Daedaleopsis nitida]
MTGSTSHSGFPQRNRLRSNLAYSDISLPVSRRDAIEPSVVVTDIPRELLTRSAGVPGGGMTKTIADGDYQQCPPNRRGRYAKYSDIRYAEPALRVVITGEVSAPSPPMATLPLRSCCIHRPTPHSSNNHQDALLRIRKRGNDSARFHPRCIEECARGTHIRRAVGVHWLPGLQGYLVHHRTKRLDALQDPVVSGCDRNRLGSSCDEPGICAIRESDIIFVTSEMRELPVSHAHCIHLGLSYHVRGRGLLP